jgi:hypothetical protein
MVAAHETVDVAAVALALLRRGFGTFATAEKIGLSQRTVQRLLHKARRDELMGRCPKAYEFTPRLECRCNRNPIRLGEVIVCVWCCSSGWDFHPDMHADPLPRERKRYRPSPKLRGGV